MDKNKHEQMVYNNAALDRIKEYEINDIERLICHIECIVFRLMNNYIFTVHNSHSKQQHILNRFQNMKHEMETYKQQLQLLEYFKNMKYNYLSDIQDLSDKHCPILCML